MTQTIDKVSAGDRVAVRVDVAQMELKAGDVVWVRRVDGDAVAVARADGTPVAGTLTRAQVRAASHDDLAAAAGIRKRKDVNSRSS